MLCLGLYTSSSRLGGQSTKNKVQKYHEYTSTKSSEPPRFRSRVGLAWGQPKYASDTVYNTRKSSDIMCHPLVISANADGLTRKFSLNQTQHVSVQRLLRC
jgi:hypothetical protein